MFLYNKDSVTASGEGMKSHSSLVSPFCGTSFSVVPGSSSFQPTQDDGTSQNRLFPGMYLAQTSQCIVDKGLILNIEVSKSIGQRVTDRPSVQWTRANMTGLHCDQAGLAISAKVRVLSS